MTEAPVTPRQGGLPPLIGREAEIERIRERLRDPACRWLSLVGAGGVGKTSLARRAVESLVDSFRAPPLFLNAREDADTLAHPERFADAVLPRIGSDPDRPGALLLILDELESLQDPRVLQAGFASLPPGVTVLATSRIRLRLPFEWVLEVAGLETGNAALDPRGSAAARMFESVARRTIDGFRLEEALPEIEEVCTLVDGLPLAIELAARQCETIGLSGLRERLRSRVFFRDPDPEDTTGPGRLAEVMEQAWNRLPVSARRAALKLASLPGECDLDLAQLLEVDLASLETLRAHSWLTGPTDDRLSIHGLQREYLRRRPDWKAVSLDVSERLQRCVEERLQAVPAFGEFETPSDKTRSLAQQLAGSVPILHHVTEAWVRDRRDGALERLAPHIDAVVAHHLSQDRAAAALEALRMGLERGDLPFWRRGGWLLRRAEIEVGLGLFPGRLDNFTEAYLALGLIRAREEWERPLGLLRSLWHVVRLPGWPGEPQTREALRRLLHRCLVQTTQLQSFSQGAILSSSLIGRVLALRHGSPEERETSAWVSAYGSGFLGFPRLSAWIRPVPRTIPSECADGRAMSVAAQVQLAARAALGELHALSSDILLTARRQRHISNTRGELECLLIAAKQAFYQGRLAKSLSLFRELSDRASRRPGDSWWAWGMIGEIEVRLCLPDPPMEELQSLLQRAARLLSELENLDNAHTIRLFGLAARLAWARGDHAEAREHVLTAIAMLSRLPRRPYCGHEGYAGICEVYFAIRREERSLGAVTASIEAAWKPLLRELKRQMLRFPASICLLHRVRALCEIDRERPERARALLRRSIESASRQGLRVELARSHALMAQLEADGGQRHPIAAEDATLAQ